MPSIVERVREHIQDPWRATSMSAFTPRQHSLYPPATLAMVKAAEAKMGLHLPALLVGLYTLVGNGGFGPGYGIFGLEGGYVDQELIAEAQGGTLVDWYVTFRGTDDRIPELQYEPISDEKSSLFIDREPRPDQWTWFDKLVPICNHGCWQLSCIDCSKADFPVLRYDGQQSKLRLESPTFDQWIGKWLNSIETK